MAHPADLLVRGFHERALVCQAHLSALFRLAMRFDPCSRRCWRAGKGLSEAPLAGLPARRTLLGHRIASSTLSLASSAEASIRALLGVPVPTRRAHCVVLLDVRGCNLLGGLEDQPRTRSHPEEDISSQTAVDLDAGVSLAV